ncbi:cache domain-containing protein [Vallitalea okinawensis]|uniref:cache domain-containing protein n=1 Tax=Vallitalea okinawensis TaxID=2078660 RepID=UPI000CFD1B1F|nr:cache domain-containing protein [Vallitalea okinawensis]
MKFTSRLKKISLLSSIISIIIIVIIVGSFIFQISHADFVRELETIKESYYNEQKKLIQNEVSKAYDYIDYQKSKTEDRLKTEIQDRVNEAHSVATNIYNNNLDKTDVELERMIINALSAIRFNDGNGYYFIGGLDGKMILFPVKPELENQDLLEVQDSNGNFVIKDMITLVNTHGEGFYEYYWAKPSNQLDNNKKISFIKYFEPLNVFIGSGLYIADLEQIVKKEVMDMIADMRYENDGYFFLTTYDGQALVFAQEEYIGKDVSHIKDVNGISIHNEEIKVIDAHGEGYIEYMWEKPNVDGFYPKITFVKGITDWEWVLGTGVYVDDIEETIENKKLMRKKEIESSIIFIAIVISLSGFGVVFVQLFLLRKAEQAIKAEERLYEILTNLSEDGIFILEPNGKVIESNIKGVQMLTGGKENFIQLNFKDMITEIFPEDKICEISKETHLRTNDDNLMPVEIHIKSIELDRANKYIAYLRDLTSRKLYEETLKEMAITDELTHVYNRRFIIDQLQSEIDRVQRLSDPFTIVMVDLDKFKMVNDTYGHVFGDEVLKVLTMIFKDHLRKIDFVGRYGGEEFIIILPGTNKESACKTIQRIKEIFKCYQWVHQDLMITFSAGAVEINRSNCNEDVMTYINQADQLLYKAKQNGRDRIEC